MKLHAYSKVITLTALGFTLTAAGAFYSLNEAQSTLDNQYNDQLKNHLRTVGSDLSHYVQRINNDYYQLINLSLANVLALGQPYYNKDPLLSFFEHNFRYPSPYNQGENLLYALEALNYFKVPFVSYNFANKELKVHGASDEKQEQRILNARAQDGSKLKDLITTRSTLSQSFGIFYFGGDTYLCLKIYDRSTQSNYFVIDSYLSVLNNTAVNVKKIFSDIDPVMQGILKDDNVMIVRRGNPIFKTQNFKLNLDLENGALRKFVGIHIVDHNGTLITEPQNLKPEQEAYILGVSYLSSINSYLVMQRPFESYKADSSFFGFAKILLVLLSLVFVGLVVVNVYRSGLSEQDKKQRFAQLIKQLQTMTPQELQERLNKAYLALKEHKAKAQQNEHEDSQSNDNYKDGKSLAHNSSSAKDSKKAIEDYKHSQDLKDMPKDNTQSSSLDKSKTKVSDKSANTQETKNEHSDHDAVSLDKVAQDKASKASQSQDLVKSQEQEPSKDTLNEDKTLSAAKGDNGQLAQSKGHQDLENSHSPSKNTKQDSAKNTELASTQSSSAQEQEAQGRPINEERGNLELSDEHVADGTHNSLLESDFALEKLSDEDLLFIENYLTDELLQKSGIKSTSLEGLMAAQTFRFSAALDSNYQHAIHELKDTLKNEFKSRINVHRMEGKFMAARSMLLSALPAEDAMPSSNYIDFAACTVPARELSGNFYTMKRLRAGNLAFVIGDCSSSGVKAAYTVTVVNTLLKEALRQDLDPAQILSFINERLYAISKIASVSLFVGIISETTGNVITANAGHCCPILISNTQSKFIGRVNELRLGLDKDTQFEISKCSLSTDDMILLYTNGVLNVKNNDDFSFGIERLLDHCERANAMRADELVINVLNDIKLHKGKRPFREDVSLICIKQLLTERK